MKRLLLLVMVMCLLLVACDSSCDNETNETNESQENDIIEAETFALDTYVKSFEMYIYDANAGTLTDDKANFSVELIMSKENDINKKDDYDVIGSFYKYSYTVNISGIVDDKYAGKTISLYGQCFPEHHALRGDGAIVAFDGSFEYTHSFDSNVIISEWIPARVTVNK